MLIVNLSLNNLVFADMPTATNAGSQSANNQEIIFNQPKNENNSEVDQKSALQRIIDRQMLAIQRIKNAIASNNNALKNRNKVVDAAKEQIDNLEQEITKLEDLINYYNSEINQKEPIIESLAKQVTVKENDIIILNEKVSQKEIELQNQKDVMSKILGIIYLSYNNVQDADTASKTDRNPLKALLSANSLSSFDQEITYLSIFEVTSQKIFTAIKSNQEALNFLKQNLDAKKENLQKTKNQYEDEKKDLEALKIAKEKALSATKEQKNIFQKRLELAKKQETQISKDTEILFRTLQVLNDDLEKYKNDPNVDLTLAYNIQNEFNTLNFNSSEDLIWPASPYRGITALFHDQTYPFRSQIGEHQAVDIRIPQGTPLFAPMNGVITYANGYDINEDSPLYYAYQKIVITDPTGRSVVMGHVSATFVKKGDYVVQGDLLGLSGALPGTKGAGPYTTGAHLHLELHIPIYDEQGKKKIIAVDPLLYFPLDDVSLDSLDKTYLSTLLTKKEEIYAESNLNNQVNNLLEDLQ